MTDFVRVADGLKSNASGYEYKINEINISNKWNPKATDDEEFGGFNFAKKEHILRWLNRGDTLYDVEIPKDAESVEIQKATPVQRANKIIIKNPRKINDDSALELYKISKLNDEAYYTSLAIVAIKNYRNTAYAILNDLINKQNIDAVLDEWNKYINHKDNLENNALVEEIYNELLKIKSEEIKSEFKGYIKFRLNKEEAEKAIYDGMQKCPIINIKAVKFSDIMPMYIPYSEYTFQVKAYEDIDCFDDESSHENVCRKFYGSYEVGYSQNSGVDNRFMQSILPFHPEKASITKKDNVEVLTFDLENPSQVAYSELIESIFSRYFHKGIGSCDRILNGNVSIYGTTKKIKKYYVPIWKANFKYYGNLYTAVISDNNPENFTMNYYQNDIVIWQYVILLLVFIWTGIDIIFQDSSLVSQLILRKIPIIALTLILVHLLDIVDQKHCKGTIKYYKVPTSREIRQVNKNEVIDSKKSSKDYYERYLLDGKEITIERSFFARNIETLSDIIKAKAIKDAKNF